MKKLILVFQVLFGGDPVAKMQRKSGDAFNIFKKTLKRLQTVNDSINVHKAAVMAAIEAQQTAHSTLVTQQEQNDKLINKLNEFVNPQ